MSLTGSSNQQPEFEDIVPGLPGIDFTTTTLYYCPSDFSPCRFRTTKAGMKEGAAAIHLKRDHQVTGAMMKNSPSGTYKFRKVRQENK